jgi:hypothetical protein
MTGKTSSLLIAALFMIFSLANAAYGDQHLITETSMEGLASHSKDGRHHLNHLLAPIRSRAELDAHLNTDESPLMALSDPSLEMFLDSLIFGEHNLASFRRNELEAELTVSQIYEILSLFGFQQATPGFVNARIESERDLELLGVSFAGSSTGTAPPCGDYVEGKCYTVGTCKLDSAYCCDPPSCKIMIP